MAIRSIDNIDGGGASETSRGWEFRRVALVDDLAGAGDARLVSAVAQVKSAVGDIGAPHPVETAARIDRFDASWMDSHVARVVVNYLQPAREETVIEVGAAAAQTETNKDRQGNVISVAYNGQTQGGFVPVMRPEMTVVIERVETESPGNKAKKFVGAVNSGAWLVDPDAEPREWLCTSIVGRSNDSGVTYAVRYEFQFRRGGWNEAINWTDTETRLPPPDVSEGNGIEIVEVQPQEDFEELALVVEEP